MPNPRGCDNAKIINSALKSPFKVARLNYILSLLINLSACSLISFQNAAALSMSSIGPRINLDWLRFFCLMISLAMDSKVM
jgi:hypothetical protein